MTVTIAVEKSVAFMCRQLLTGGPLQSNFSLARGVVAHRKRLQEVLIGSQIGKILEASSHSGGGRQRSAPLHRHVWRHCGRQADKLSVLAPAAAT
jgi:hypothetical protein